jgi:hypothetical protein
MQGALTGNSGKDIGVRIPHCAVMKRHRRPVEDDDKG